jgi:glycosyltransferase involved in cell wall biosynthesis
MQKGIENGWILKEKACVIHNGIVDIPVANYDLHKRFCVPSGIPIIATVARLSEPKDPIFAIKVAHRIKHAGYDFRLFIIGDGPLRKSCEELICELDMADTALILGTCNNVREMLPDIDIVLLFSKWEGLPISVIEAMFAGKPVIASNVGGLSELVSHGVNGFLLDKFDIEQASHYIIELIEDAAQRELMGNNGRKIARQEFTLDKMVQKYHELYSK